MEEIDKKVKRVFESLGLKFCRTDEYCYGTEFSDVQYHLITNKNKLLLRWKIRTAWIATGLLFCLDVYNLRPPPTMSSQRRSLARSKLTCQRKKGAKAFGALRSVEIDFRYEDLINHLCHRLCHCRNRHHYHRLRLCHRHRRRQLGSRLRTQNNGRRF